jgi:predicted HTH transcriptional regulator
MIGDELSALLQLDREQSGVEFKGPLARTDKVFFAKVTRAVLGMSNRRDGGVVVIGVEDVGGVLTPVGLTDEVLKTWVYDHVADGFAEYGDPSVAFDMSVVELDGKKFVVLRIEEFGEVPVLCRKSYGTKNGEVILRGGACYVRPRRKPETVEVATYADMRDLLDLATDKNVRRFVERAYGSGLMTPQAPGPGEPPPSSRYQAERAGFE